MRISSLEFSRDRYRSNQTRLPNATVVVVLEAFILRGVRVRLPVCCQCSPSWGSLSVSRAQPTPGRLHSRRHLQCHQRQRCPLQRRKTWLHRHLRRHRLPRLRRCLLPPRPLLCRRQPCLCRPQRSPHRRCRSMALQVARVTDGVIKDSISRSRIRAAFAALRGLRTGGLRRLAGYRSVSLQKQDPSTRWPSSVPLIILRLHNM